MKRRQRNRRVLIVALVVIVAAVVAVGIYAYSSLQSSMEGMIGRPISPELADKLYTVAQSSYGSPNQTLLAYLSPTNGPPFTSNGKPVIVFISADYCPFCAFQRWPIILALMRFGNFTNLHYMLSSPTDVFANSPTFSFYGSSYTSKYVCFEGYEEADRNNNPQQSAPANYTAVFQQYGRSSYPFLDIGNRYYMSGAFEYPTLLGRKDWNQIASLMGGSNALSSQIIDSANVITAAICKLTGGNPSSVCGMSSISSMTATLASFWQPAKVGLASGSSVEIPSAACELQGVETGLEHQLSAHLRSQRTSN